MRLGVGFGLGDAALQLVAQPCGSSPGKSQMSDRCPSPLTMASPSIPSERGELLVRGSAFCSRLWTLGMREGSFSSSRLDSWCQSRHCPGWRREGMNEQRSNETVCAEALCKQRCGTHRRVGDYGLYTCRAGALPGTEQELGRTFGNRGWTAEGSRRWRPGPPGSTGSGGIRVRCSLGRALVNRPRGRRGRKWDQLRRKGDVMLLAA